MQVRPLSRPPLLLKFPALAIFAPDVLGGLGGILGAHLRTVPFQFLAGAHRHAAEQHDLGQISRDIEVGVGRRAAFARGDPFLVLAFIRATFERIPRDRLRDRFDSLVLRGACQLLLILELREEAEIPVAIVGREQLAFSPTKMQPLPETWSSMLTTLAVTSFGGLFPPSNHQSVTGG